MQLFIVGETIFSKKINMFFALEHTKKAPSKVAHNRPPTFFLCTGPAAQMAQKQKSRTTKSPLMQDWVFRLGFWYIFFPLFFRSSCKSTKSFSIYKSTLWIQETNWTFTSWSYWTYGYFKSYFWGPFLNYFTKETNQKSFLEAKNEAINNLRKAKKNKLHCHNFL